MNSILADSFALYLKTKSFHWHVSGPRFSEYHRMFDEQAAEILASTDGIAERVRKIGGTTLRSVGHIARLQRVKDNDLDAVSAADMLAEPHGDNINLIQELRHAKDAAHAASDNASSAMLDDWIDQAEKRAWFSLKLRAESRNATCPESEPWYDCESCYRPQLVFDDDLWRRNAGPDYGGHPSLGATFAAQKWGRRMDSIVRGERSLTWTYISRVFELKKSSQLEPNPITAASEPLRRLPIWNESTLSVVFGPAQSPSFEGNTASRRFTILFPHQISHRTDVPMSNRTRLTASLSDRASNFLAVVSLVTPSKQYTRYSIGPLRHTLGKAKKLDRRYRIAT